MSGHRAQLPVPPGVWDAVRESPSEASPSTPHSPPYLRSAMKGGRNQKNNSRSSTTSTKAPSRPTSAVGSLLQSSREDAPGAGGGGEGGGRLGLGARSRTRTGTSNIDVSRYGLSSRTSEAPSSSPAPPQLPGPRSAFSSAASSQDTMDTLEILDQVNQLGGFGRDTGVWAGRPQDHLALSRLVRHRNLAPSSVGNSNYRSTVLTSSAASNANNTPNATRQSDQDAAAGGHEHGLPALPDAPWTDIEDATDLDLSDPTVQLKIIDNIAYFGALLTHLTYKRRLAAVTYSPQAPDQHQHHRQPPLPPPPRSHFTETDLQNQTWAQESIAHYNWLYHLSQSFH